ncbi:MAG TPA: hypothetical protein VFI28_07110 [Candidatus Limnocylindrales bacterium]|nr:hypothetical protein [Candidatus Limnocylindrales bacterium]
MIRNVVLHLSNEQPLLADLYAAPTPADLSIVCTNLRTMNGSRPVFVDRSDSLFVFPFGQVRFVEVTAAAIADAGGLGAGEGSNGERANGGAPNGGAPNDERANGGAPNGSGGSNGGGSNGTAMLVPVGAARAEMNEAPQSADGNSGDNEEGRAGDAPGPADDLEQELEIDEDFLRRVREI